MFRVHYNELSTAFVTMQVFSRDQYARQKLVGEINVVLDILAVTRNYRTWSNVLDYDHQVWLALILHSMGYGSSVLSGHLLVF